MKTVKQVRDLNNDIARDRYQVRTSGDGNKEVVSYFDLLPSNTPTQEDSETREECNRLRVRTGKNKLHKTIVCRAHEVVERPDGIIITRYGTLLGGVGGDWSATLHEEKRTATDKALLEVHYRAMSKLKDLRPELFYNEEELETRNKQRQFIDDKYKAAGLQVPAF